VGGTQASAGAGLPLDEPSEDELPSEEDVESREPESPELASFALREPRP
jgi:hypothetical protein